LLAFVDQAKPYAERMVYREGTLVGLLVAEGNDCTDGAFEVIGQWRQHMVPPRELALMQAIEGNIYNAAISMETAGYVLGIAVGRLLRAEGGAR
jgi:hypothetical protein